MKKTKCGRFKTFRLKKTNCGRYGVVNYKKFVVCSFP